MDSERLGSFGGHVVDAVGSFLTSLLVFAATPAVLIVIVGYPLGGGLGHQWDQGARVALTGVTLVAWVAWAACCTQLTRSVVAQVRQGHISTAAGAVLTDRVAARIAAGVLSLVAIAAPLFVTSGAGASMQHGTTSAIGVGAPSTVSSPRAVDLPVAAERPSVGSTYVVRPGDSLWSIAQEQLGDGGDWPALAALNLGRTMTDGLRFVDPSLIHAGWTLELPDPPGPTVLPTTGTPAPAPFPVASATAPPSLAPSPSPPTRTPKAGEGEIGPVRQAGSFPETTAVVAPSGSLDEAGPGRLSLPELSALGIGALACAALARRSRRMRILRQLTGPDPTSEPDHSPAAVDADIVLDRFTGIPALHAFEAANYRLGLAEDQGGPPRRTAIRAICVGPAGVDFWLAEPGQPAPAGCDLSADGKVWHAGHDAFISTTGTAPFLPIVLPVGEDEAGTWLIPLQPGSCLPLVGEAGGDLWRAAQRAQEAWAWSDMVLVTDDPTIVARELAVLEDGDESTDMPMVLFFGEPASLSVAQAQRVAIVSLSVVAASDVTVLVDRSAATIHPLGRTVRPHLMGPDTSALVDQLVAPPRPVDPIASRTPTTGNDMPVTFGDSTPPPLREHPHAPTIAAHAGDISLPEPGTVEVRLLTPDTEVGGAARRTGSQQGPARHRARGVPGPARGRRNHQRSFAHPCPRIVRCRRGVEDAVQHRRGGPAGHGHRSGGAPLFPAGIEDGALPGQRRRLGRCAPRRRHWPRQGSAAEDPEIAMGLLRSALNLVEGEPLANALSGYGWWEAEGHGARIAAELVNAASDLAALAVDAARFELAQWGLETGPAGRSLQRGSLAGRPCRWRRRPAMLIDCARNGASANAGSTSSTREAHPRPAPSGSTASWRNASWSASPASPTSPASAGASEADGVTNLGVTGHARRASGQLRRDGRGAAQDEAVGAGGAVAGHRPGARFGDHVVQQAGEGHDRVDPQVAGQRSGNGVDLVDHPLAAVGQEVDPGHPADERQLADAAGGADAGRRPAPAGRSAGSSRGALAMPSPPTYLSM